ncbi:MAG: YggS family pyridoxal phosphate-dependent enzyme [Acidimicrobiales bacterium]
MGAVSAPERPTDSQTRAVPVSADALASNLAGVRERIAAAGADPARVRVVAVTKGFGPQAVTAALEARIRDVGENYAQELLAKVVALGADGPVGAARHVAPAWHFLGSIQRNKVAALAPHVVFWHSVERLEAGQAIARHQPGARILVQVNVSREASKHGCPPDATGALVAELRQLDLDVAGLMAVGPAGPAEAARPGFRELAQLARQLGLAELSMGMSGDLEVAVQEGATMIRVGRSLFGPRPQPAAPTPVGSLNGGK